MATVRKSLDEIKTSRPRIDRARLKTTTEADIRRHQIEDEEDPDAEPARLSWEATILPQAVRKKLGMTQEELAAALRIPVKTLRNWEQNRVKLDPAVRSLLLVVYKAPETVFQALADPA
jgi:putative transcriptional regulator